MYIWLNGLAMKKDKTRHATIGVRMKKRPVSHPFALL